MSSIGLPNAVDRPDRVRACTARHDGPCTVCGFDGRHLTRPQVLERRQFRGACTCNWFGPIRQEAEAMYRDRVQHRRQHG